MTNANLKDQLGRKIGGVIYTRKESNGFVVQQRKFGRIVRELWCAGSEREALEQALHNWPADAFYKQIK